MNHANKITSSRGFTLIELMLSMTFISVLLLAIAMTVIQISHTYNRGITLKDVNQSGRAIVSELQRGISESAPFSIESGPGSRFVNQAGGGRLCVGRYSYIWNYGSTLNKSDSADENKYSSTTSGLPDIRFVKVFDSGSSYCLTPKKAINPNDSTELLISSDHNLALHRFNIASAPTAVDNKTKQRLYSISFYLGTNETEALVNDATSCKAPGEPGADIAYCSVQEFNITVRAGNLVD